MNDSELPPETITRVDGIDVHYESTPDEEGGLYSITTPGIRLGTLDRLFIADPHALRALADVIEVHDGRQSKTEYARSEYAEVAPTQGSGD